MNVQEIADFHRRCAERCRGKALRARWKADKVGLNALAEFHVEAATLLDDFNADDGRNPDGTVA